LPQLLCLSLGWVWVLGSTVDIASEKGRAAANPPFLLMYFYRPVIESLHCRRMSLDARQTSDNIDQ
jgi:hypothetical protein